MASAPQAQGLPLFYNDLQPLSSDLHGNYRVRVAETAPFLARTHAVPVTVEEFPLIQRHMPIVFSAGDEPVPLALMGLNEGTNVFFDADGKLRGTDPIYVPAYVRRYPYLLARLRPDSEELSLCFDPTSDTIGAFDEGDALFADGKPTELVQQILKFNEEFEIAGQKTGAFLKELSEMNLLMDGEVSIQPDGAAQPYIYRGFRMVDEAKLNELRGDQLRKMQQSGMLPLVYAHLFSLGLVREIFARQMQQGNVAPQPAPAA
ncbi:SapC family protein [Sphingomonas suaedae]|uniref:SapC family protein n=1 Tax=Sphingomonas suaedae TaxID=2599297 RepID=A0A518RGS6_9SPHN|nr:SapC family protein [Sphingomonas suaedae]QDX26653.1 SapC family protein [Sphingomonas suaedae]